jgi:radical SAM superfamily enzyme YgiQ (UPF0313 family)
MRVALTVAPYDPQRFRSGPALGPAYLAAALSLQGHEVDVFDLTLQNQAVEDYLVLILKGHYGMIGFSCLFTSNLLSTLDLVRKVRDICPLAHICVGGQATSFIWKDILDTCAAVDSVACFEADETICELIESLHANASLSLVPGLYYRQENDIHFTGFRDPPKDLDRLPFPRREQWSAVLGQPHFIALTSRGCSAHCTFCCSGNFGNSYHSAPRWRARSSENILQELDDLVAKYQAQAISFVDDDFLGACAAGPPRALEFADKLRQRNYALKWSIECRVNEIEHDLFSNMKAVGLSHVFIGIESGNPSDLKLFGKGASLEQAQRAIQILRSLDLSFRIGFIMFHPLSTLQLIEQNLNFLFSVGIGGSQVLTNQVELYAGSPLLNYFSRKCELIKSDFGFDYTFTNPEVTLYRRMLRAILRFYKPMEIELERARFRATTGIDRMLPEDVALPANKELSDLQERLWKRELVCSKALLETVRAGELDRGVIDPISTLNEDKLIAQYRVEAERFADEIKRGIARIDMKSFGS